MSLIGTMGSGVSALRTFMKGLEVIGNNIANVNTTGFKASNAQYADSFSNVLRLSSSNGTTTTTSVAVGTGVLLAGVTTNFTQGSLQSTGKSTDLGISGNGYFRVKNPNSSEEYVTRAGDFRWDEQGYLVTTEGYRVQGLVPSTTTTPDTLGDIKLTTPTTAAKAITSVAIDRFGGVVESYADGSSATTSQLLLQDFKDPSALVKAGGNMYTGMEAAGPTNGAPNAALLTDGTNNPGKSGLGTIQAGTLELSNVDLTEQFSDLITTQRSFQAGSRLLTVSDTILEDIVNLKR
jgi:flagellar hook protein FlgE